MLSTSAQMVSPGALGVLDWSISILPQTFFVGAAKGNYSRESGQDV